MSTPATTGSIKSAAQVAALLDHAILHPAVTREGLLAQLDQFADSGIASVCVRPSDVAVSAQRLKESTVAVGTVVGFPHGTTTTATKVAETKEAVANGAKDIDMVINVGAALSGDWQLVEADIAAVTQAAHAGGSIVKVIFETGLLPGGGQANEQGDAIKAKLCEICTNLGTDFVKTSTGFGFVKQADGSMKATGATEHDIALMKKHSGPNMGLKPSGGIRTLDQLLKFVELGATRIGTGSSASLIQEAKERFEGAPASGTKADAPGAY